MAYLSLSPVTVSVYALLNVSVVTSLAPGGVRDDVPQAPTFPFVWLELREQDIRGFGTGGLPEVELRVHTFSRYEGMKDAQAINAKVIELLRDQALSAVTLTASGYKQAGLITYRETVPLPDEELHGVKVRELVSIFTLWVEET